MTKRFRKEVAIKIIPLLRKLESEYVTDAYITPIEKAFARLRAAYILTDKKAKRISASLAKDVDKQNALRFKNAIKEVVGVDLSKVVANAGIDDILKGSIEGNVSLIKTIPGDYFDKIEGIVYRGTIAGNEAKSMIEQIREIGHSTTKRAKVIARDQTAKLNSNLSKQRQLNAGVKEYVWRTATDGRVRESHKRNNGKTFRWDKPPKATGHPGQDVQCRCFAQPIIEI